MSVYKKKVQIIHIYKASLHIALPCFNLLATREPSHALSSGN